MLKIALKLFLRKLRAGEFTTILLALVIATTLITAIRFYTDQLQNTIQTQTSKVLGGDLVIQSGQPTSPAWKQYATQQSLKFSQTDIFPTMIVYHTQLQFVLVQAVDDNYPLIGTIEVKNKPDGTIQSETSGPAPGDVWVEQRIDERLRLKPLDTIKIGKAFFVVRKILLRTPDTRTDWFNIAPRLLMNQQDLPKTQIIYPGSQVQYFMTLVGAQNAIEKFNDWIKPQLGTRAILLTSKTGAPRMSHIIQQASDFLQLSSLVCLLFAAVSIQITLTRYFKRERKTIALLRCLGTSSRETAGLYLLELCYLGLTASLIGILLGYLIYASIGEVKTATWHTALYSLVISGFLLFAFALPIFFNLNRWQLKILAPLISLMLIPFVLWATAYGHSIKLLFLLYMALLILIFGLFLAHMALLQWGRLFKNPFGVPWQYAVHRLLSYKRDTMIQLIALSFVMLLAQTLWIVQHDLVKAWLQQLPKNTPNYFVSNLLPTQLKTFQQLLAEEKITSSQFYPMTRGRLITRNHQPIENTTTDNAENINALHRELYLTQTNTLPSGNQIIAGQWQPLAPSSSPIPVSIEESLQRALGVNIGDILSFTIGGRLIDTRVTSVRTVQWDSFHPNFYFIFPEKTLDDFPISYLGSFFLPPTRITLLNQMTTKFPSMTLFSVSQFIEEIQMIVEKTSQRFAFLLGFILAAALVVFYSIIQNSLDERLREQAILRLLGTNNRYLLNTWLAEWFIIGASAGLISTAGANLIAWTAGRKIFHFSFHQSPIIFLLAPLVLGLFTCFLSMPFLRRLLTASPLLLLHSPARNE